MSCGQKIGVAGLEENFGFGFAAGALDSGKLGLHGCDARLRLILAAGQDSEALHDGKELGKGFKVEDGDLETALLQKTDRLHGLAPAAELQHQLRGKAQDQLRVGAQMGADGRLGDDGGWQHIACGAGNERFFPAKVGQDLVECAVQGDDPGRGPGQADFPAQVVGDGHLGSCRTGKAGQKKIKHEEPDKPGELR